VGDRLGGPHDTEHETAGSVAPAVPTLPFKFNGAGTPPHSSPSGGVFPVGGPVWQPDLSGLPSERAHRTWAINPGYEATPEADAGQGVVLNFLRGGISPSLSRQPFKSAGSSCAVASDPPFHTVDVALSPTIAGERNPHLLCEGAIEELRAHLYGD
jgi:hypothetical protein